MKRLGLTGGIGSGKSTVAHMLAAWGAVCLDADAISRSLTAAGGAAMPAIAHAFGPALLGADGALDRDRMRALVFHDPSARQRLQAIIHPLVSQATEQRAREAERAGARLAVFDIPLLVESGRWARVLDAVMVVDCSEATQIARVMARNGLAREAVQAIIAAQATRAARCAAADIVVYNDDLPLPALEAHMRQIATQLGL